MGRPINTRMQHRPLSPHLQIYRLPLVALLSIGHRITGVFLSLGYVALAAWLVAVASGGPVYELLYGWFASTPGTIAMVGWSAALYFHLCNGIRHLFWDAGYGFELQTADASGIATLIVTAALTGGTWWILL